ncbi:Origin recognition complex subunit 1 [Astathelohania contejeani]|uniref:Origin recognition complex subunit 1 n=1 Tax=Astathelohania contejeani TaxID=164912 RepID=A0ABQ7I2A4_9MICR|nr:Origin recognition complex subunit 1 [Thelohania contejeani]
MKIIGRARQASTLKAHLSRFWTHGTNPTVYISGVPGSGKTYTLLKILNELDLPHSYINCARCTPPAKVYQQIMSCLPCSSQKGKDISHHLMTCKDKHILVLDEIDLLITRTQQHLYTLFNLPCKYSNVLVVAISNTANLPEQRFDSKICSRIGSARVDFPPYTASQLAEIYKVEDDTPANLVCKRVGAISGDVRRVGSLLSRKDYTTGIRDMYTPLYVRFIAELPPYCKAILEVLCGESTDKLEIYETFLSLLKSKNWELIGFEDFNKQLKILSDCGLIKVGERISLLILKEELNIANDVS